MTRWWAAGLGGALGLLAASEPARACSCSSESKQPDPKARYIFEGKVVKLRHDVPASRRRATMVLGKIHRGPPADEIELETDDTGGMCGFEFAEGESYLVYLAKLEPPYTVSLCSPTKRLSAAGADLALLATATWPDDSASLPPRGRADAPRAPEPEAPRPPPSGCSGCTVATTLDAPWPAIAALLAGLAAARTTRRPR
jgi:hypothetical protein